MTIEIIALIGFVFIATSLIAKVYERRNDVLYGPYVQGRDDQYSLKYLLDQLEEAIESSRLRQGLGRVGWRVHNVSYFASAIIC
jgi:hypothetical protein